MGGACCKASKANEDAHVVNHNKVGPATTGHYRPKISEDSPPVVAIIDKGKDPVKGTPITGDRVDNIKPMPIEAKKPDPNPSDKTDYKPREIKQEIVTKPDKTVDISVKTNPEDHKDDPGSRPIDEYPVPIAKDPISKTDDKEIDANDIFRDARANSIRSNEKSVSVYGGDVNPNPDGAQIPEPQLQRKESDDIVLPMYTTPLNVDSTALKKQESQGTKNLDFILEQNQARPRDTTLKAVRTGWLQINYIPEVYVSKRTDEVAEEEAPTRKRPKVAKFGSIQDEEIRKEIYDKTNYEKPKDLAPKFVQKSAVDIEIPNYNLEEFNAAAHKLRVLVEKIKKEAVVSVTVGKSQQARITHNKKQIIQAARPEELYANATLEKLRVELGA